MHLIPFMKRFWVFPLALLLIILVGCRSAKPVPPETLLETQVFQTLMAAIPSTETIQPTLAVGMPTSVHAKTSTPNLIAHLTIGYSVEKRPLEVVRFGNGEHHIMIVAGIHGGYEWNTVKLADELVDQLKTDPGIVPADKTLYIMRLVNPDGFAKDDGPDGRANADNVDLNRNWDANWQANWWGSECWNYRFITAGKTPFSEPETQALSKFLLENKIEALISYHSAGLGIFPGGWPNDKNSLKLAYAISQVSPYPYPPRETDCYLTGQMIDWASANGIAAVDVELNNHVDTDLAINLEVLKVFLNWSPISK